MFRDEECITLPSRLNGLDPIFSAKSEYYVSSLTSMVIPRRCGGGGVFFLLWLWDATSSVFFFVFFLCISTTIGPTREDVQYGMILSIYTSIYLVKQPPKHFKPFFLRVFCGTKKVFVPKRMFFFGLFTGSLSLAACPAECVCVVNDRMSFWISNCYMSLRHIY